MGDYLKSTGRSGIASASEAFKAHLTADEGCKYDQVVEIDLSTLEPHINGPFTPDLATPLSQFKAAATGKHIKRAFPLFCAGSRPRLLVLSPSLRRCLFPVCMPAWRLF